ncbi:MAG: WD40/YVTN/BNR-like repeat-containing protein, partial [Blastocatellia bacterium]
IWRSDDKGKTWRIVSNNNNRPMYYSKIRVDPSNPEIVYTGGVSFTKSTDGGKTFVNLAGVAHSDHHAIWINPKNGNHLINGNDGGLNVSYDQGATFDFINTIAASQFYAISADMRKPYYICGGLQDNGSWCGPSATRSVGGGGGGGGGAGITNADWFRIGGGDGFYTQNDPTDHNIVYLESQNGNVQRLDLRIGRSVSIRPRAAQRPRAGPGGGFRAGGQGGQQAPQGQNQEQQAQVAQAAGFGANFAQSNIVPAPPVGEQYRFNWNTPVVLSPHNPRIVYVGANKLFKSLDRGETWTASPDLTKQIDRTKLEIMSVPGNQPMASKNDGVSNYSNITTIAESPLLPGVLWVGTDDGNVQLSKDGGATWNNIAGNIPTLATGSHLISRVEPSHFDAGTCYVTIDGHRSNDHKPYVYVTKDYGATWTSISNNLPVGNVNVIREDLKNRNLLFVGTEYGLFVSLNGGGEWKKFMTGLPTVRVDDLLIHPRDNDLIAGTHGRGVWIVDDITPLQQLNEKTLAADTHLFDLRPGTQWLNDVTLSRYAGGAKLFRGENPQPGTAISYYLKSESGGEVKITISDITGKVVRNLTGTKGAGLNRVMWNLRGDPPPRPAGARFGPAGGEEAAQPSAGQPTSAQPAQGQGGQPQPGQPGQQGGGGGGRFGAPQGLALDPGTYLVKLSIDGKEMTTKIVVEADSLSR